MYKGGLHAPVMSKGGTFDPEEVHTRLRELMEELGESRGPAILGPEEGGPTLFLAPAYEAGLLSSFNLLLSASAANGALASLANKLHSQQLHISNRLANGAFQEASTMQLNQQMASVGGQVARAKDFSNSRTSRLRSPSPWSPPLPRPKCSC